MGQNGLGMCSDQNGTKIINYEENEIGMQSPIRHENCANKLNIWLIAERVSRANEEKKMNELDCIDKFPVQMLGKNKMVPNLVPLEQKLFIILRKNLQPEK